MRPTAMLRVVALFAGDSDPADVRVRLGDVANPPVWVVGLPLFGDAQVAHREVRDIVHGHLKIEGDGPDLFPRVGGRRVGESDLDADGLFGVALELFDGPGYVFVRVRELRLLAHRILQGAWDDGVRWSGGGWCTGVVTVSVVVIV